MSTYADYQDLKRRKPVRFAHEAIIDDLLAYPRSTGKERSARLGYSESYLSIVMNTDMFKAYFEERRLLYNQRFDHAIQHKTMVAVDKALDLVVESLDKKRDKIPFTELAEFTDRTLERLGYGVKQNSMVNVLVNTAPAVTKEQLADARRDLRAIEEQREKVIDITPSVPLPPKAEES